MANMTLAEIKERIVKGSIDPATLSDTLKDLRLYAYSYLYNLQKDMVNICKLQVSYEDLTTRRDDVFTNNYLRTYLEYNVKIPFIHHNRRLRFRRSDLYNVPITNDDVEDHRDIFVYSYFVFVDGIWDKSARIRCREEITSICLRKENMAAELQEHFGPSCKIDIIFIPDVRTEELSATKLDFAAAGYKFSTTKTLKANRHVMVFLSKGNELPRLFEATLQGKYVIIPEAAFDGYEDLDMINISAVIMPNYLETIDAPVGANFINHVSTPMPIPEDNVLLFRLNTDSSLTLDCGSVPVKKYPNIFELNPDRTEHLLALVYYWDNNANRNSFYDVETHPYASFIDILAAYSNGNIRSEISTYIPYLFSYEVPDYQKLGFGDNSREPIIYKANKLFEAYKLWAYASQLYHEKLREDTNSYIIYTDNLDMESKKRTGTQQDFTNKTDWITFDEEMYVFIFTNTSTADHLPYKFWINGLRFVPDQIYLDGKYQYVYIPVSKIPEGTVIEVERSTNVWIDLPLHVTPDEQQLDLTKLGKTRIPFCEFYVTDADGCYLIDDNVHFRTIVEGETFEIPKDSTMLVGKDTPIFIYSDNPADIQVYVSGAPIEVHHKIDLDNFSIHNLNHSKLLRNIPNKANTIRVFNNGRLLAHDLSAIEYPTDSNEPIKVWFDYPGYGVIGDFQVDYIPEGYNLVYSTKEINSKGILDLSGKIDKPFSMKYYDVYLNGYRLLPNQIDRIANFIIQIKNVDTLKILEIYEKNYAEDGTYVLDEDDAKQFLADRLYENDEEFRQKLKEWIEDIIPDTSIPDVDRLDEILEFVVNSVTMYMEIKPFFAYHVLDEEFTRRFAPFFENDTVFFLDANKVYPNGYPEDENKVYFLSPQKYNDVNGINIPIYVEQFSSLMKVLGAKFLNANAEREDISKFNAINDINGNDEVIMISGDNRIDRFGTDKKISR